MSEQESDADLATILADFTNYIMNERVRAFNEGVDVERERCARIAENYSNAKPGDVCEVMAGDWQAAIAKAIRDHQ